MPTNPIRATTMFGHITSFTILPRQPPLRSHHLYPSALLYTGVRSTCAPVMTRRGLSKKINLTQLVSPWRPLHPINTPKTKDDGCTTPTIAVPSDSHRLRKNVRSTLRCSHTPTCTKLRIVPITETKARNEAGWRK